MKTEYKDALKCMVFAQSFVESLEDFKGSSAFRQQLKNKGNAFMKEMDIFLHSVYDNGSTDRGMIDLIEGCQQAIDKVIDEDVEVVE